MQKPIKLTEGYRPLPKDKPLHNGWQPSKKSNNIIIPPDSPKKKH